MGAFVYNRVTKYRVRVKNIGPLHIGGTMSGTEDILTDSITGLPFIQASTLAGMFRSTCNAADEAVTEKLFGTSRDGSGDDFNDGRSRLKFSDARNTAPSTVKYEIRPGVAINRKTGSVNSQIESGQKFDTTYVSENAVFLFYVYLFHQNADSLQEKVEDILGIMLNGEARAGAKKSSGAGRLEAEQIEKTEFDLTTLEGRKEWIAEDDDNTKYVDIKDECRRDRKLVKYNVIVEAKTEGPIQVKGIAMSAFGKDAADSENIRNGNNEYIIPGSSFRGVIRSRMERIAGYLGKSHIIDDSFGYMAKDAHMDSHAGNLVFYDSVIRVADGNDIIMRNRIHIDKFTGGVISQALFKEKNVVGDLTLNIQVCDSNNPDATLGLLLYSLRDLALNMLSLGNGYATGKGFLKVSSITIESNSETTVINFEEESGNKSETIMTALTALKEA